MIIFTLLAVLCFIFIYMTGWFVAAWTKQKNDLADLAWGLGFTGVAFLSLFLNGAYGMANILSTAAVFVWGTRLFNHIYERNHGKPEDYRYAQMRKEWGNRAFIYSFLKVFMLQGFLLLLVSAPVWYLNTSLRVNLDWLALVGFLVWVFGFLFEAIGDWQLKKFISNPDNKGRIMKYGLWKYTRHPNYFGEVTLWWGLYIVALAYGGWWTAIGPITISFLILKVSGIPLLESRYAGNPEFEQYKKETSAFFPLLPNIK